MGLGTLNVYFTWVGQSNVIWGLVHWIQLAETLLKHTLMGLKSWHEFIHEHMNSEVDWSMYTSKSGGTENLKAATSITIRTGRSAQTQCLVIFVASRQSRDCEKCLHIKKLCCNCWILDAYSAPPMLRGQYSNSSHLSFWGRNYKNVTILWTNVFWLDLAEKKCGADSVFPCTETIRDPKDLCPKHITSAYMSESVSQSRRHSSKSTY